MKEKLVEVFIMEGIPVIFQGKEYHILHQYASGYCEIIEKGPDHQVQMVHFSELKLKEA